MRRPPLLSLLGLAVAAAGLVLDAVVHLSATPRHHQLGFSLQEHGAHMVVLIGMLLILGGIVWDGMRRTSRRAHPASTTASTQRSSTHATR
jgi:hypothetical protein